MIEKLTTKDIGRWVVYSTYGTADECGKVKSYDNKTQVAWVVYKWGAEPWRWEEYTAQATNYSDLKLQDARKDCCRFCSRADEWCELIEQKHLGEIYCSKICSDCAEKGCHVKNIL